MIFVQRTRYNVVGATEYNQDVKSCVSVCSRWSDRLLILRLHGGTTASYPHNNNNNSALRIWNYHTPELTGVKTLRRKTTAFNLSCPLLLSGTNLISLINFTYHSSYSEADSGAAGHDILRPLRNTKVN
jgi:hypothetical protein